MVKKKIITIIIILILLMFVCFFIYSNNTVKAGNTYFTIPDGYSTLNEDDYINLTNGHDSICVVKNVKYTNLNDAIKSYSNSKNNENLSVSNFKCDDYTIFKSVSNRDSSVVHYWVECNGKINEFFSWNGDSKSDELVSELVKYNKRAFI